MVLAMADVRLARVASAEAGERDRARLVFVPAASDDPEDGTVSVVVDMAWSGPPGAPAGNLALRDLIVAELRAHDLFAEASATLDAWAAASDLDATMTVEGVSFWASRRLGLWWAVHDWLLWVHVIDALVAAGRYAEIDVSRVDDAALTEAARAVAARDGLVVRVPSPGVAGEPDAATDSPVVPAGVPVIGPLLARLAARRERRAKSARRRALDAAFSEARRRGPATVLVFMQHVKVEVRTGRRRRRIDPYLEPVATGLAQAGLYPLRVVRDVREADEAAWRAVPGTIPWEVVGRRYREPADHDRAAALGAAMADRIRQGSTRLLIASADLGPAARAVLAREATTILPGRFEARWKIRRLLEETRASSVLLAYEYGRPEWIAAARDAGVPVAAVQHGMITAWHPGYTFAARPAGLPIADRTFVYGRWERDRLVNRSVYRDAEVVVAGAPRLDLVPPASQRERDATRRELRARAGERLVVHSTSWGSQIQRFYTPAVLDAILDRPLPGVHLVLKLHPSERSEQGEVYRGLIEQLARIRGFEPPRVTVVWRVDLYRLLRAADAHLGLYSTVLTDAVAAGTPNLLLTPFASRDTLDYVAAGVALPVRDGGELLAALDVLAAGGGPTPRARELFLADHFEPGAATPRIVAAIRSWADTGPRL